MLHPLRERDMRAKLGPCVERGYVGLVVPKRVKVFVTSSAVGESLESFGQSGIEVVSRAYFRPLLELRDLTEVQVFDAIQQVTDLVAERSQTREGASRHEAVT